MVVDRNIGVGHADCSCRRLPGNFRKDTVAFGKDGGNMTASHIVVAELIAGVVVEVGHTLASSAGLSMRIIVYSGCMIFSSGKWAHIL